MWWKKTIKPSPEIKLAQAEYEYVVFYQAKAQFGAASRFVTPIDALEEKLVEDRLTKIQDAEAKFAKSTIGFRSLPVEIRLVIWKMVFAPDEAMISNHLNKPYPAPRRSDKPAKFCDCGCRNRIEHLTARPSTRTVYLFNNIHCLAECLDDWQPPPRWFSITTTPPPPAMPSRFDFVREIKVRCNIHMDPAKLTTRVARISREHVIALLVQREIEGYRHNAVRVKKTHVEHIPNRHGVWAGDFWACFQLAAK